MAVRPIDGNELYRIEKLLDTDIVRQDKVALNLLEQALYDIQHVPTLTPPNDPLTVEQLRGMDGRPAYWPDDESWGIISVDDAGRWAGIPFFRGHKNGVNFEYDIVSRGMEVYAYPPAHIDREKWGPCMWCVLNGQFGLNNYCSACGRPLTDEAWAELERRIESCQ